MIELKGIPISGGIAIGKAFVVPEESYVRSTIGKEDVKKEISRYKTALQKTKQDFIGIKKEIMNKLGSEHIKLADIYLIMLDDPLLTRDVVRKIQTDKINAESALFDVLKTVITYFEKIEEPYFKDRKVDFINVCRSIMKYMTINQGKSLSTAPKDSILVSHTVSPEELFKLKDNLVNGIVTASGSATSHVSILARELNIPAVTGIKEILKLVKDDDMLIIDGENGVVIISPDEETLKKYQNNLNIEILIKKETDDLKNLPAITPDGFKIKLLANINSSDELHHVTDSNAEGVGLMRTEFIYLNRTDLPTEDEHFSIYESIAKYLYPKEVTIRTIDIGYDKLMKFGVKDIIVEPNPALGLRGIRLCLKYPEIFKPQLKGLIKAAYVSNIKLMIPMVTFPEELIEVKKMILNEIGNNNWENSVSIGAMIETPAAALFIDDFLKCVDFISVGTNDLIQYLFVVDRTNEEVSSYYDPFNLAFINLLENIIRAAKRHDKDVSVCGVLAGDPLFVPVLIGLGIEILSLPCHLINPVKKIIRKIPKYMAVEILNSYKINRNKGNFISQLQKLT